jgi:hypothetical protein
VYMLSDTVDACITVVMHRSMCHIMLIVLGALVVLLALLLSYITSM